MLTCCRCRSTELSCGRGRLPEVAHYRLRHTMHAPCMPTMTLADVCTDCAESHPILQFRGRNAAELIADCSTSVLMCRLQHPRSAAKAAKKRRRRPRLLLTAYAPRCSGSTLGTLERCQRPQPASPGDLLLVLDAPSAGGKGTVVWNVMLTQTGSRNTCLT